MPALAYPAASHGAVYCNDHDEKAAQIIWWCGRYMSRKAATSSNAMSTDRSMQCFRSLTIGLLSAVQHGEGMASRIIQS